MKRYRVERWVLALGLLAVAIDTSAQPASQSAAATGASAPGHGGCPARAKQGTPPLHYDCLNRVIAPKAVAPASGTVNPAEGLVTQPPNRTGTPPTH